MPEKSVTVFSFADGHDASAALIRDGKVLAALQEERLTNIKHYDGTPERSMRAVFEIANVEPSEVNVIAIANLVRVCAPTSSKVRVPSALPKESSINKRIWLSLHMLGYVPFIDSHTYAKLYVRILHKFREMRQINKVLENLGLTDKETVFVDHHMAHASAAYRSSPWSYNDKVLVVTADGAGDGLSSTVNIGREGRISRVASSTSFNSLGNTLYGAITVHLGLKPWEDEYKTMGLAPYGQPERCIRQIRRIIRISPKNSLEFENTISPFLPAKLQTLLYHQRFDHIAAAVQKYLEELLVAWIGTAIHQFDVHKIACAGGIFLNVKANKRIREMPEVEDLFVYPAAGDDGTSIGAGLQAYFEYCRREGIKPAKGSFTDVYYGPYYEDDQVEAVLKETGWIKKAQHYEAINLHVADMLAHGKIIARFNGRSEWGPRALGNRSILADARELKIVNRINSAIKHRDFWMPFAPTILEDQMSEYLVNSKPAPYMILAFDTTEKRDEIVASIHPWDKTCRPQTLTEAWNPGYFELVEAFREKTGVGGLLNTSFNLHGYPMVCDPKQALWTLENSELDGLALGNYYITRKA
jgi:carbamoyltransferase